MSISRKTRAYVACTIAWVLASSCDEGSADEGEFPLDDGPAYVVATRVWDDTSITSYFHVLPSLEAGTPVDPARALEVPGSAKLYAIDGTAWLAIGGGDTPTITRYELDEQRALVARESIGLHAYGVSSLWDGLYVVSPTKVYYPDRDNQQLIVINPTAMTIDGAVALPQTARPGYLSLYGYTPVMRGDELLFSVGWFDWDSTDSILGETGLVVLDTVTDTVVRVDVDTRCGGITQPVVTDTNEAWFVSSALAAAAHRLERLPTAPCALRIAADADAFDPGVVVDLGTLTGGLLAGEPVPGGGSNIFLRVLDENLAQIDPEGATWQITGQAAWAWWRWNVQTQEMVALPELRPSTSDVLWFEVDGRVFGADTPEDYSQTTLIELTAAGGPRPTLVAPGFLHAVARAR